MNKHPVKLPHYWKIVFWNHLMMAFYFRQGQEDLRRSQEGRNADRQLSPESQRNPDTNLPTAGPMKRELSIVCRFSNQNNRWAGEIFSRGVWSALGWKYETPKNLYFGPKSSGEGIEEKEIEIGGEDGWTGTGLEQRSFTAGQWHSLLWRRSVCISL